MSWKSKRQVKEEKAQQQLDKRVRKLRHKDLFWAAKRRYLDDKEWYELHVLDREFGRWGAEQSEYEFNLLSELREYFKRHEVGSKCPHMNALQRHLAQHAQRQEDEKKASKKKVVKAHPKEPATV
jgi:sulfur relay (sulfurtransferase) DsrC/TusE family protein